MKEWQDEQGRVFCTCNDYNCPYYSTNGECKCPNVEDECSEFYFFWEDEIEAEKRGNVNEN